LPLLLLRHASAGDRATWQGDDRERPLDARGLAQADKVVVLFEPFDVTAIYASPYRRCAQTVEALAASRSLVVELRDELGEDQQHEQGAEFVRSVGDRNVVICGHGGLDSLLLDDPPRWRKGETFVLDDRLRLSARLR
jgi:phosphohistidine phosphatase SixA